MIQMIKNLNWRYATKQFDAEKKVSDEDLSNLMEVVRLSPSSYGLQLYKVLVIEDLTLREKLKEVSFGQSQITDASHLFVFCNYQVVDELHVDEYFSIKSQVEEKPLETFQGYSNFIKNDLNARSEFDKSIYTAKQCYLALGHLLAACAEMKIDACPMEGFDPNKFNEILGLSERGLNAAVIATIGYRSEEDQTQFAAKVRKPGSRLFEMI